MTQSDHRNTDGGSLKTGSLLDRDRAMLVVVDMQQKLLPAMRKPDRIEARCGQLLAAAKVFDVPVFATEQYPKGLGPTVPSVAALLPEPPVAKLAFSAAASLAEATDELTAAQPMRSQVLLVGIETHVCVLQTAFDFQGKGFEVFVAIDATGSRKRRSEREAARRMRAAGCHVVTTESAIFECCRTAEHESFREVSRLIR